MSHSGSTSRVLQTPRAIVWALSIVGISFLVGFWWQQPLLAAALCFIPACGLGTSLGTVSLPVAGGTAFAGYFLAVSLGVAHWTFPEVSQAIAGALIICGFAWQSAKEGQVLEERDRIAETDSLTGLLNRNGFLHRLDVEANRAERLGTPLAIVFLDCDHFKSWNDQYGHLAGDRLIVDTAQVMKRTVRNYDSVARMGGDEFAILYPGVTVDQAEAAVHRLHQAFESLSREYHGISWTIGVAVFLTPQDAERMLDRADQLMLSAKRTRKGTVLVETFGTKFHPSESSAGFSLV